MLADAGSIPAASTNHRSFNDHLRPLKPLIYRGLGTFLQNPFLVIASLFRAWFGHHLGTSCFFISCRQRRQEPKQGQDVRQTSGLGTPLRKTPKFRTPLRKTPEFGTPCIHNSHLYSLNGTEAEKLCLCHLFITYHYFVAYKRSPKLFTNVLHLSIEQASSEGHGAYRPDRCLGVISQTYSGRPDTSFCGVNLYNPAKVSPMGLSQFTANQISNL